MVDAMPYVALQQILDGRRPTGMQNYWTADFYSELPDEAIDTLVEHTARVTSPLTQVIMVPGGGAVSRVPEQATAFGNRTRPVEHPLPDDVARPGGRRRRTSRGRAGWPRR